MNNWNLRFIKYDTHMVIKISILSRRCFDRLAFPGSSRFAYAHQFTQTWWEKSQTGKRMHKTSRSMKNLPWKSSKCHLISKLKLAPPRRRITLRAGRNKLYESLYKLEAGGKPSTWFPPGGLVELIIKPNEAFQIHLEALLARIYFRFTRMNT